MWFLPSLGKGVTVEDAPMKDKTKLKVGVLLNGCGAKDGSEIHESVLTLLALDELGVETYCLALDRPQTRVVNHLVGSVDPDASRNMLHESARIARGQIRSLAEVLPGDLDAVIIPGGNGTAYNLCDFAEKGAGMQVEGEVERFLRSMHEARKPIGAVCIAPVLLAKLFGHEGVLLTLGLDDGPGSAAAAARSLGAKHQALASDNCVIDEARRMVTTPAYMNEAGMSQLRQGIKKMVEAVVGMAAR